jgi:hypothetical protein
VSFAGHNDTRLASDALGDADGARLATAAPEECLDLAAHCDLAGALHECAFAMGGAHATEVAGCLERCNASAGPLLSFAEASACCGLQCLDSCWPRALALAPLPGLPLPRACVRRAPGAAGALAPLHVHLVRSPPAAFAGA